MHALCLSLRPSIVSQSISVSVSVSVLMSVSSCTYPKPTYTVQYSLLLNLAVSHHRIPSFISDIVPPEQFALGHISAPVIFRSVHLARCRSTPRRWTPCTPPSKKIKHWYFIPVPRLFGPRGRPPLFYIICLFRHTLNPFFSSGRVHVFPRDHRPMSSHLSPRQSTRLVVWHHGLDHDHEHSRTASTLDN